MGNTFERLMWYSSCGWSSNVRDELFKVVEVLFLFCNSFWTISKICLKHSRNESEELASWTKYTFSASFNKDNLKDLIIVSTRNKKECSVVAFNVRKLSHSSLMFFYSFLFFFYFFIWKNLLFLVNTPNIKKEDQIFYLIPFWVLSKILGRETSILWRFLLGSEDSTCWVFLFSVRFGDSSSLKSPYAAASSSMHDDAYYLWKKWLKNWLLFQFVSIFTTAVNVLTFVTDFYFFRKSNGRHLHKKEIQSICVHPRWQKTCSSETKTCRASC